MVYRPFRNIGRFVLAACAVSLGVASLSAQTPSYSRPGGDQPFASRLFHGVFLFWRPRTGEARGNSAIRRLMRARSEAEPTTSTGILAARSSSPRIRTARTTVCTAISAGPIFRAPMQNFTLFAHGLVGGARPWRPEQREPVHLPQSLQWGPTLTAGGGMDYDLPFFDNRFSPASLPGGLSLDPRELRSVGDRFRPAGALGGRAN